MQFPGKLMKQTWRNDKRPNFRTHFVPFGQDLGSPIFFFVGFTSIRYLLYNVVIYHCLQFQGKLVNQTWENDKKPNFRSNFGLYFDHQILFSKISLRQSLDIMVSYHHVQYQKKLIIQSWENLMTDGQTDKRTDGQMDRQTRVIS